MAVHSLESVVANGSTVEVWSKSYIDPQKIEDTVPVANDPEKRRVASNRLSAALRSDTVAPLMKYDPVTQSLKLGDKTIAIVDYADQQSLVDKNRDDVSKRLYHRHYLGNGRPNEEMTPADREKIKYAYLKSFDIKDVKERNRYAVYLYLDEFVKSHDGSSLVSALPKPEPRFRLPGVPDKVRLANQEKNRITTGVLHKGANRNIGSLASSTVRPPSASTATNAVPEVDPGQRTQEWVNNTPRFPAGLRQGRAPRVSTLNSTATPSVDTPSERPNIAHSARPPSSVHSEPRITAQEKGKGRAVSPVLGEGGPSGTYRMPRVDEDYEYDDLSDDESHPALPASGQSRIDEFSIRPAVPAPREAERQRRELEQLRGRDMEIQYRIRDARKASPGLRAAFSPLPSMDTPWGIDLEPEHLDPDPDESSCFTIPDDDHTLWKRWRHLNKEAPFTHFNDIPVISQRSGDRFQRTRPAPVRFGPIYDLDGARAASPDFRDAFKDSDPVHYTATWQEGRAERSEERVKDGVLPPPSHPIWEKWSDLMPPKIDQSYPLEGIRHLFQPNEKRFQRVDYGSDESSDELNDE
jgi:hypothetical protein